MTAIEITLIVIGIVFVLGSFFIKDKLSNKDLDTITDLTEKELKIIVDKQLKSADTKVGEYVDDAIDLCTDKTKRDLERTTNEKIMAINEYSDTVLEAINKSHNEVMFLYSMLNDKHTELTGLCGNLQRYTENLSNVISESSSDVQTTEVESSMIPEEELEFVDTLTAVSEETVHQQTIQLSKDEVNHNIRILEMNNQGYSDVEIAKELNLGLGEVRLVIGLFKGEV